MTTWMTTHLDGIRTEEEIAPLKVSSDILYLTHNRAGL